jgi:hypothetical protein
MTLTALLSTCAMVMGLGGIVPQLVRMVRTRSAGGQALAGWGLGTAAHASMTYVNLVGFHSVVLGAYSITAGSLCAVAMALIATLQRRGEAAVAPALAVDDLATHEFAAVRAAVLARDDRSRTCRSQPARHARGRARTMRAAAPTSRA